MTVRFAVAGDEHAHVRRMTGLLLDAGAELVSCWSAPDLARGYPRARLVSDVRAIFEDASVHLVVCGAVPCARAALAMEAMRHGQDVLSAKPAVTSLEDLAALRRTAREERRIWSVFFSERVDQPGTLAAAALARAGEIGEVVHVDGFGPHRLHPPERPAWFFSPEQSGGILTDLGSHQIDQFLFFTGSRQASVTAAAIERRDGFQVLGEAMLRGERASGHFRVDWLSPAGLPTWGDGRLFLVGTAGFIEVRKNCDLGGRAGGDHVLVTNRAGVRYLDAGRTPRPFAAELLHDIVTRASTAMPPEHCFRVCELALRAQAAGEAGLENTP